ncbi:MAG: GAF domain-containing sensor histidine kinase [Leptolyngbya sp. SIO4C1]|nr:GAF domain-containing sensor histidine kinase [Leptolyngbya sp. SIO4C1]
MKCEVFLSTLAIAMNSGSTLTNQPVNGLQTQPACLLDGLSADERDRDRVRTIQQLNLLEATHIPIFEEAVQTVSRWLSAPVCILSIVDQQQQRFKAAIGLSSMGLMNQLAAVRLLPRQESFCTHVVESAQTVALENIARCPVFSDSLLVHQYGVQAYLGVPLVTSEGCCIGALAVMDLLPRQFTAQEKVFLELNARWCMSEYERQHCQLAPSTSAARPATGSVAKTDTAAQPLRSQINDIRLGLISQLTQDLRNPLTAITGMANMLSREIYGPLSEKQQEYAKIVLDSSQALLSTVDEIVGLGSLAANYQALSLAPIDIEMLTQQSLQSLNQLGQQQGLDLTLSIEPGSRLWVLDKRVIKQLIHYLLSSIIKLCASGSTVRLHISRKEGRLHLAVWVSNPWLGDDLPQPVIAWCRQHLTDAASEISVQDRLSPPASAHSAPSQEAAQISHHELGLLLSRYLTEIHQGTIALQGSLETGYRCVVSFPSLAAA